MSSTRSASWYLDRVVAAQKAEAFLGFIRRQAVPARGRLLKTDLFEEANGEDHLLPRLASWRGARFGVDREIVTALKACQRSRGDGSAFAVMDLRFLAFTPASFDLVISASTLDHFPDAPPMERCLDEMTEALAPGGTMIVILDNPWNPLYPVLRWWSRRASAPFRLGHTLSAPALCRRLEARGLEVLDTDYLIHNPRGISTALFLGLRWLLGERADGPVRGLLGAFSLAGRLPTRRFTACFLAVAARKP